MTVTAIDPEAEPRRATDRETALARSWVAETTADWADAPDNDDDRQAEYERALEIIIHANGGRAARPGVGAVEPLGFIVLTRDRDDLPWSPNWDGEMHTTREAGESELAAALHAGCDATLTVVYPHAEVAA